MRRAIISRLVLVTPAIMALLVLFYAANWMFTPELVGVVKLECIFRPRYKMPFDPDKWRNHENVKWGVRYEMVDQLLEKNFGGQLTLDKVYKLLGAPNIKSTRPSGEIDLMYNLGSQETYPSRSILFPGRLQNVELWVLMIRIRSNSVVSVKVVPT